MRRRARRMTRLRSAAVAGLIGLAAIVGATAAPAQTAAPAAPAATDVTITPADCVAEKAGTTIAAERIGEPVRRVTIAPPVWTEATNSVPAYCRVSGVIDPVDTSATARPINFSVALPATWSRRAAQLGGGGMNGTIPNLTGGAAAPPPPAVTAGAATPNTPSDNSASRSLLARGFATFGSDSGHQQAAFGRGGRQGGAPVGAPPAGPPAAPAPSPNEWALNDEAIANLGYMQMKKTRDAAIVLIERLYGGPPRYTYYLGTSQGGREALTVAQRYPADYDGIAANVPIVGFSTLMLAPGLIRIHEKPIADWVTPAKVNAIRGEFMRQCDGLDGLADGIINNYMACRAVFDITQEGTPSGGSGRPAARNRQPWAAKRCPNNVDPNPADTSANACLTDGQISTLEFTYSRYAFATPLAHGTRTFGMWVPNTDPSGSGLIVNARFRGQEGAPADAAMHSHLGVLGVTGFLMKDLAANPLDYVEGGAFNARRQELSAILDSTNPDLGAFARRGGKMIVTIGTNDTLASPGAQLDYYAAIVATMGRATVDRFARLFVMPQAGHGLSGTSYTTDGTGKTIAAAPIPNRYDQWGLLFDWVEKGTAPPMSVVLTADDRSLPLCSYPSYPRYTSGPTGAASSYRCAQ